MVTERPRGENPGAFSFGDGFFSIAGGAEPDPTGVRLRSVVAPRSVVA